jgi:3-phosphoshikimate 1-carboxyvinyltransferase
MNLRFDPSPPLKGTVAVASDKSISHRAAILSAMASEPVLITGYLDAEDTNSTLAAIRELGAIVERQGEQLRIRGCGLRGALAPARPLDVGNAGTLMRLLPGWLAGQRGERFVLDGDASIRRRPVDRIAEPLRRMGAQLEVTGERFPPLEITGSGLTGITYELPVASAQVKSCVLLAGTMTEATTVVEPVASRDHTERMLLRAGAEVSRTVDSAGVWRTTVGNVDELELDTITVPGDISSAAFLIAAGVLIPGSRLVLEKAGLNWTRTGFLRILERMGAIVIGELEPAGTFTAEEPVSELDISHGPLQGTTVEAEEVPLAIDELPLVALLGCFAEGETIVSGAAELRVKESDRIATVVDGLRGLGAEIEAAADGFRVVGTGGLRGGTIDAHGDHRLALVGAVAGLASAEGVEVIGFESASVSYPTFTDDLARLSSSSS